MVNVAVIQHTAFEDPGMIRAWALARGHHLRCYPVCDPPHHLPDLSEIDLLVLMGGPMSVHDADAHPWLRPEKALIQQALAQKLPLVGICLGAQLLAEALGANVARNPVKEIGWFSLSWQLSPATAPLLDGLPAQPTVLHWHGDRFETPLGAYLLATSRFCDRQGFWLPGRVLGLQFHLEVDSALLPGFISHGTSELAEGPSPSIQDAATIAVGSHHAAANRAILDQLLDRFLARG